MEPKIEDFFPRPWRTLLGLVYTKGIEKEGTLNKMENIATNIDLTLTSVPKGPLRSHWLGGKSLTNIFLFRRSPLSPSSTPVLILSREILQGSTHVQILNLTTLNSFTMLLFPYLLLTIQF
ncbi:hypothetical protein QL285_017140 [Trifolium repens]|nr:hypothetical protein QL285_017140 [Trifolium repens]